MSRSVSLGINKLSPLSFVDCSVRMEGRGAFLWCDIERSNRIGQKKQVSSERSIKNRRDVNITSVKLINHTLVYDTTKEKFSHLLVLY